MSEEERVYSEQILPLMKQIAEIAEKNTIPFLALFALPENDLIVHHLLGESEQLLKVMLAIF